MQQELEIGEEVEIINYGSKFWCSKEFYETHKFTFPILSKNKDGYLGDEMPELIGQRGIITRIIKHDDHQFAYELGGINGKSAWYFADQLKLIASYKQLMAEIERYSNKYEFSFQFWGIGRNNVYIAKDNVELWDSGGFGNPKEVLVAALQYIYKINRVPKNKRIC